MTARDELRRAVAAEFQRLDAHQFGYDHGFCADPDADPETAAFVDAAIRIVLGEAAEAVMVRAEQTQDMKARIGLGVAHYVLTEMADAAAPSSKEPQR